MADDIKECKTCKHWCIRAFTLGMADTDPKWPGTCKAMPPVRVHERWDWPQTLAMDWCGQYHKRTIHEGKQNEK